MKNNNDWMLKIVNVRLIFTRITVLVTKIHMHVEVLRHYEESRGGAAGASSRWALGGSWGEEEVKNWWRGRWGLVVVGGGGC